jgi:rare lipoprotein A
LNNRAIDVPKATQCSALQFWGMVWLLAVLAFLQACTSAYYPPPPQQPGQPRPYRVFGRWYQPLPDARDFVQSGVASWYGRKFHGRKTSSGETYNMYDMTAAHKTLPLGTYVRVYNLENGRRVDVRINDRGPFVHGRIIDLSYSAAKQIALLGPGTAKVRVEALGAPAPDQTTDQSPRYIPIDYYSGNFTFQVGAFTDRSNAQRLVQKLEQLYKNAHTTTYSDGRQTFYRVRVGRAASLEDALRYEQLLVQNGFPDTFIVAE